MAWFWFGLFLLSNWLWLVVFISYRREIIKFLTKERYIGKPPVKGAGYHRSMDIAPGEVNPELSSKEKEL